MMWEKHMKKTILTFIFACMLVACGGKEGGAEVVFYDLPPPNHAERAYEDGLRAGHVDAKQHRYCDHPFPREVLALGYGSLYLSRFEVGYFKGCALARKSAAAIPKKRPSQPRTKLPVTSRCEA